MIHSLIKFARITRLKSALCMMARIPKEPLFWRYYKSMLIDRSKLLERGENAKRESRYVDFKREFDSESAESWCEIIKDIIAFANSGGGIIVFGLNNDGLGSGYAVDNVLDVDIADITNKIQKYTGYQFSDIDIVEICRGRKKFPAFIINGLDVPLVFIKPGTYAVGRGQQKSAFTKGVLYFRHGGKSEPAEREDLIKWRDESLARAKDSWLGGIRKVVEAPADHVITVVSSPTASSRVSASKSGMAITAKISADPGAVRFAPQNAEEIWPHRQTDLLREINKEVWKKPPVNGHDVLCINTYLNVLKKHPEFAYKPHRVASPQYSSAYAEWIINQYKQDPKFFKRKREEYRKRSLRQKR